jgi:hypothetical protein
MPASVLLRFFSRKELNVKGLLYLKTKQNKNLKTHTKKKYPFLLFLYSDLDHKTSAPPFSSECLRQLYLSLTLPDSVSPELNKAGIGALRETAQVQG